MHPLYVRQEANNIIAMLRTWFTKLNLLELNYNIQIKV